MRAPSPSRGEAAAWKQLRLLRQEGFAFRREQPIGAYRADFVCLRRRVIVEVDGRVHALPGRAAHDAVRDAWLAAEDFVVLRFADTEILSEANWLAKVRAVLITRQETPYRKRYAPLPLEGGGQGGGESVARDVSEPGASNGKRRRTPHPTPLPPPPLGAGEASGVARDADRKDASR